VCIVIQKTHTGEAVALNSKILTSMTAVLLNSGYGLPSHFLWGTSGEQWQIGSNIGSVGGEAQWILSFQQL